jgi:hypothetical protein
LLNIIILLKKIETEFAFCFQNHRAKMIPYIVAIARPDWKRPYCEIITDVADNETQMIEKLHKIIVDEMIDLSIGTNSKFDNYSRFHDKSYSEYYMHQKPIEIKYFINGRWIYYDFETKEEIMNLYNAKYNEKTAPISCSTDDEELYELSENET